MHRRIAPILLCTALSACATPGPEPTATGDGAEAAAVAGKTVAAEAVLVEYNVPKEAVESGLVDEDTVVCRREKVVGSHIPKKVCLSAREREKLRNESRAYLDKTGRAPDPRNDG